MTEGQRQMKLIDEAWPRANFKFEYKAVPNKQAYDEHFRKPLHQISLRLEVPKNVAEKEYTGSVEIHLFPDGTWRAVAL